LSFLKRIFKFRRSEKTADLLYKKKALKLRALFITPIAIALVLIVLVFIGLNYQHQQQNVQRTLAETKKAAAHIYQERIEVDSKVLSSLATAIQHNSKVMEQFRNHNRSALLTTMKPIYKNLNASFSITHLYFIEPNGRVFLRVHSPSYRGDIIKRITLQNAKKTAEEASGVELGPLGTLTLRVVKPWYEQGHRRLLGYLELGMEIDGIAKQVSTFLQSPVVTMIDKNLLTRTVWEDGMRKFNRQLSWDRYAYVVSTLNETKVPLALQHCLSVDHFYNLCRSVTTHNWKENYRVIELPIFDVSKQLVAKMLITLNISSMVDSELKVTLITSIVALLIGAFLLTFFYLLVSRVASQIEKKESNLEKMATHDGLTGLFNHKTFYELLEKEMFRAHRYKGCLALLMIDIDFFKKVNDTFGHQAGDLALRELANYLTDSTRGGDTVCRYGGEEIMIIMPELNKKEVLQAAERLREGVANLKFKQPKGKGDFKVTVSIGVVFYIAGSNASLDSLVAAADAALYEAKTSGRNRVCSH
jgi:diguanylate cyclase (GGDEF)-like protein